MNRCIKCGREIPLGELFCIECSLNPGSSLFDEPKPAERHTAPIGRMQTPRPVKRKAPPPVQPVRQERKSSGGVGIKVALVLVSLMLVGAIAFMFMQYDDLKVQRTRLETKEADMIIRDKEREELALEVVSLEAQLAALNDTITQKNEEISSLKSQLSGSQNSQNQSEYDLSTTQAELARLEEENKQLLLLEEDLEADIKELTEALKVADSYKDKSDFMDNYVVFVENNDSRVYHTYDCQEFSKSNFWAYSRRLAESNGFGPCPVCKGQPIN